MYLKMFGLAAGLLGRPPVPELFSEVLLGLTLQVSDHTVVLDADDLVALAIVGCAPTAWSNAPRTP